MKIDTTTGGRADLGRVMLGSLLYASGSAILYVLPAYLGELGTQLGMNAAQMGAISAAENIGIALASVVCMLWLTRIDRRTLAIAGTLFCATLNLVAFFSRRFEVVMAARFLTGLLGEGILFSLAFAVLGATRDPDRSIGIGLTVVVIFGSVVLASAPYLDRIRVGAGALLPLAILPLGVLAALKWMPSNRDPASAPSGGHGAPVGTPAPTRRLAFVAVGAMTLWFAAPGAFWTFAESAAAARKVPDATISIALAFGNAAGLLGSVAAAWQGDRWGRPGPIVAASTALCVSVVAFGHANSVLALAVALSAFNIFWNYATVYEMALVVALDPAGRVALGISAAQVAGFAAGGLLSGFAISAAGYAALPLVVGAFTVAGLLGFAPCFRAVTRRSLRA